MSSADVDGWVGTPYRFLGLDIDIIVPGHGALSVKKDLAEQREYLLVFDRRATELCVENTDTKLAATQLKEMIPKRSYGNR